MTGIDILFILFFAYIFTCVISAISINLINETRYGLNYRDKLSIPIKYADRQIKTSAIWMPIFNIFIICICAKIYMEDYMKWLNKKLDNLINE